MLGVNSMLHEYSMQCFQWGYWQLDTLLPLYVTVHAKTSLVRTKIEINFLSPAYSYTH